MTTALATDHPSLASQDTDGQDQDPFLSSSTSSNHHRFSHFDNQLFALSPAASPDQAKRALEAHLAETERRIQDASKLGTTLVQQRKELAERLKDVEKQQSEGDITPELRQKLVEIEREYNEVGRETARAFLPKSRVTSAEISGSPFASDAKRSISPSKFESQATSSPSKLNVPSRKQRNQPSNRVHDIEFATEISTSLLSQVRHLQALLAEKEESLKAVTLERSNLEVEREGLTERLRELDESEQRYKDENWNLETQLHELIAKTKESADREQKLTQNLQIVQAEKSATQKELDEIKLSHAKLSEEHVSSLKHNDVELGSVKRSMIVAENERGALQRKVDELIGQNQELARAVAERRGRAEEQEQDRGFTDEDFDTARDDITPEHSPPPSPIKGTPRHSMLESETLKSSLHHAHRMIQNLKGNIHREKTEKLELKRMLQDARDELETRRGEGGLGSANGKRNRKVESKEFKKPPKPGQLGGLRGSRSEIFVDDPDWEEDGGHISPSRSTAATAARTSFVAAAVSVPSSSEQFDTANETSDAAFETANERGTETEDFQTGVEDVSGSDELTETEGAISGSNRGRPTPLALQKPGNRQSFQSTASTSGDEDAYDEVKTPTAQPLPQRLRLKVGRGGSRRSRIASEEPQFQSSPASFANSSRNGTPQAAGQSLFAELGDVGGSDEDESFQGTPSRSLAPSQSGTPAASRPGTARNTPASPASLPPIPKIPMVDAGMMTEAWEPTPSTPQTAVPSFAAGAIAGTAATKAAQIMNDKHSSTGTQVRTEMSDSSSQWQDEQLNNSLRVEPQENARPISTSTYSDNGSQYDPAVIDEKLSKFPTPPISGTETPRAIPTALPAASSRLTMSSIYSEDLQPESPRSSVAAPLGISTINSEHVEPESPKYNSSARLTMSSIYSEYVEPESPKLGVSAPLALSTIYSEHVEPTEPESPSPLRPKRTLPGTPKSHPIPAPLVFSFIQSVDTEPLEPLSPRSPRRDAVIIPRDDPVDEPAVKPDEPETPKSSFLASVFGRNKKGPGAMAIAEDETRQSPSDSPIIETPESQRPFKELSTNTNERIMKKHLVETTDESSQTALTAEQIEEMLRNKRQATILIEDGQKSPVSPRASNVPLALRPRKSQDSIGSSTRARHSSSRNGSISSIHPPLPADSKQVIAAAAQRTGSSSGGQGTLGATAQRAAGAPGSMGPPPLPASVYRSNSSFRPRTPSQTPKSPSLRDGTTPRPMHSSNGPRLQSPTGTGRSRRSSVSSFASELDTRFNIRAGVPVPQGVAFGTDPRMINAITQTMIGEHLWKYTRKAGRGAMSDNRHRRYFWVHPYTKTLYWSDRDPSQAGRTELKAKSVPIDTVRVVTDDNPMPPGLHRKSLVIMGPGRTVKFTASTGQRHETWFNALSYLLLRTGEEAAGDTDSIAQGALTKEDVAEFNPGYGNSSRRGGPASLSSYNSRTTRNESPSRKSNRASVSRQPIHPSTSSRASMGTLSRLTNYWRPTKDGAIGTSKSRHSIGGHVGSIYEASEVHDSAEDLREMIEKQDRESNRLENVRACCDGKHDVGHLHNTSTRSRHSQGNRAVSRTSVRRGD